MIDIEHKIFTIVYNAVMQYDDSIYVTSELSSAPASFPAVYVLETENSAPARFRISSHEETYAEVHLKVSVFSNKSSGAKAEIKPILTAIDDALSAAGLRRTADRYSYPTEGITQRTAWYECLADEGGNIYAAR